jgi:hypothetical protein
MGCLDVADTASWESVHRIMTVALWDRTSKRLCSMNEEMSLAAMLLNYRSTTDFMDAIAFNNVEEYLIKVGPAVSPETVIIKPIQNNRRYQLRVNLIRNLLESTDEFNSLNSLLVGTNFNEKSLTKFIADSFGRIEFAKLSRGINPNLLHIITGISIEGDNESKAGKIYLYATNKFKSKHSRYDFVMVQNTDGLQPAQVILFLMRTKYHGICNNICDIEYYACVRYLTKSHEKVQPNSMYNCPFSVYQWEYAETRSMYPVYDIIDTESISGPAFITPVFSSDNILPISSKPIRSDKFWHIDRTFFDRAGWQDTI